MLLINDEEVKITRFPDNTFKFDLEEIPSNSNLLWKYESMEELFTIIGLKQKLKDSLAKLIVPYLPNARMDKICHDGEGLMLEYLVTTLDNLGFQEIQLLDPHSSAYTKWVKNTKWVENKRLLDNIIKYTISNSEIIEDEDGDFMGVQKVTVVFPDKGAKSRYTSLLGAIEQDIVYGEKLRNQKTGEILSFDIIGDVTGDVVLIIDDICSYGGTFYHTANKLREKGFKGEIYLYITHCEESITKGEILKPHSNIKRVYTTDSLISVDLEDQYEGLDIIRLSSKMLEQV